LIGEIYVDLCKMKLDYYISRSCNSIDPIMCTEADKIYEVLTSTRELDLSRISSLDSTTFTIKGWSVTLVTVLIGLALKEHSRELLYIGIGSTGLFALFDFFYRKVQLVHVERVLRIEKYLESKYLNNVEELKYLFRPFYLNGDRNFKRDYLVPVFLVYLIMEVVLIVLAIST
jgi:hypothetical protein